MIITNNTFTFTKSKKYRIFNQTDYINYVINYITLLFIIIIIYLYRYYHYIFVSLKMFLSITYSKANKLFLITISYNSPFCNDGFMLQHTHANIS